MSHLVEMHGRLRKSAGGKWDYCGTALIRGKRYSLRGRNETYRNGQPFVLLSFKPLPSGPKIVADEKGGTS